MSAEQASEQLCNFCVSVNSPRCQLYRKHAEEVIDAALTGEPPCTKINELVNSHFYRVSSLIRKAQTENPSQDISNLEDLHEELSEIRGKKEVTTYLTYEQLNELFNVENSPVHKWAGIDNLNKIIEMGTPSYFWPLVHKSLDLRGKYPKEMSPTDYTQYCEEYVKLKEYENITAPEHITIVDTVVDVITTRWIEDKPITLQ